jgi:hypothetical protein
MWQGEFVEEMHGKPEDSTTEQPLSPMSMQTVR